jgi:hypothetical protein
LETAYDCGKAPSSIPAESLRFLCGVALAHRVDFERRGAYEPFRSKAN